MDNAQQRNRTGFINQAIYNDGLTPKEVNDILVRNGDKPLNGFEKLVLGKGIQIGGTVLGTGAGIALAPFTGGASAFFGPVGGYGAAKATQSSLAGLAGFGPPTKEGQGKEVVNAISNAAILGTGAYTGYQALSAIYGLYKLIQSPKELEKLIGKRKGILDKAGEEWNVPARQIEKEIKAGVPTSGHLVGQGFPTTSVTNQTKNQIESIKSLYSNQGEGTRPYMKPTTMQDVLNKINPNYEASDLRGRVSAASGDVLRTHTREIPGVADINDRMSEIYNKILPLRQQAIRRAQLAGVSLGAAGLIRWLGKTIKGVTSED